MSSTIQTSALQNTLQRVFETTEYQRLLAELQRGARVISISGLVAGSVRALAVAALQREVKKTFAVVTQATGDLETWERDLRFWYCALSGKESCDAEVLVLPASETDPYAGISPHAQTLEKRALTLWRLQHKSQDFVLLTALPMPLNPVSLTNIKRPAPRL